MITQHRFPPGGIVPRQTLVRWTTGSAERLMLMGLLSAAGGSAASGVGGQGGRGMKIPEPIARAPGHVHFWERPMSRRTFVGTSAVAGGAVVTAGMWAPLLVDASSVEPTPIPAV